MYVSVNIVVCKYLLCILELLLRKHVFCYLARCSKTYATNKYLSIYLSDCTRAACEVIVKPLSAFCLCARSDAKPGKALSLSCCRI